LQDEQRELQGMTRVRVFKDYLAKVRDMMCSDGSCPACKRAFKDEAERQTSLQALDSERAVRRRRRRTTSSTFVAAAMPAVGCTVFCSRVSKAGTCVFASHTVLLF
jgi:hypothetical protein